MGSEKDLKYYMGLHYRLIVLKNKEDNGYTAYYPELPGCITCADTWAELQGMAEDAKRSWLLRAIEDGLTISEPNVENNISF